MTVRDHFQRIDNLEYLIKTKLRQISSLRDTLSISAPPTDGERVSHTKNVHAMSDTIDAIIDAEREADALVDELVNTKRSLADAINQLENARAALYITKRYLEGMRTGDIAKDEGCSRRRVEQIIRDGLDQIEKSEKISHNFALFREISA